MGIVNVRIPDDLRAQMGSLPQLNWSQIIREAVEKRVLVEKRRVKNRKMILEAVKAQDRIAEALARQYPRSWKATEVIRYWREHRYSSSTRQ